MGDTENPVAGTEEFLDDFLDSLRSTMQTMVDKLENVIGGQATVLEKLAALEPVKAVAAEVEAVADAVKDTADVAGEAVQTAGDAVTVPAGVAEDVIADAVAVPAVAEQVVRGRKYSFRRKRRPAS